MTDATKLLLDLLAVIPTVKRSPPFSQKWSGGDSRPKNGLEDVNNDGCQLTVSKRSANRFR